MLKSLATKFMEWFEKKAGTKSAKIWLFVISFTESFFFPIPVDPFMAIVILVQRNKWLYFVTLVTIASVLGAIGGYVIGALLYDLLGRPIIDFYDLHEEFVKVNSMFDKYAFWAIFTAAFTPLPFKIFTIAAGVANLNIFVFILASILGRGLRFLIVGIIIRKFGKKFYETFLKHFDAATIVVLVAVIIYLIFRIVV